MFSVEEDSKEKVVPELEDMIGEIFKLGEKKKGLINIYKSDGELKHSSHKGKKKWR